MTMFKSILDWLKGEVAWFERHGDGDRELGKFFVACAAGNYRAGLGDLLLAAIDFTEGTEAQAGARAALAELKTLGFVTVDLPPVSPPKGG